MVFRKLPGVSASGMGLRLSQKFVFLLFLSGLVTLCFGALFFLPDSVRLKRIFLSKTETQPVTVGSGSENDAREHLKRPKNQGGMTPAKGETSTKLKSLSRKPPVSHEATEERLAGGKAQEDLTLPRSKTESASAKATSSDHGANSDTFSYNKFKGCLLKPPLGRDNGKPSDPKTNERREKVKEELFNLCQPLLSPLGPIRAPEWERLWITHLYPLKAICCHPLTLLTWLSYLEVMCYMITEASEDREAGPEHRDLPPPFFPLLSAATNQVCQTTFSLSRENGRLLSKKKETEDEQSLKKRLTLSLLSHRAGTFVLFRSYVDAVQIVDADMCFNNRKWAGLAVQFQK
ncbi:hypothetical protein FQN60_017164 [Etheostoma spectabile]|uniref:Uncharacterized protein n=1 Tax=Etheostoma spectabile TaxID=54343 RepID=A0A5J5DEQ6_9PERO|nr:hypothetical protein FQN60_017164 [Etheostoma spectabile]